MKKPYLFLLAILVTAISIPFVLNAGEPSSDKELNVLAVRMYADWCGNCKALDPKIDAIKPGFRNGDILFMRLDQTEDFDTAQSEIMARLLGIGDIFTEYKGKTGIMLLIDSDTKKLLEVINHRMSEEEIAATLKKYQK
jgi:thiol-disulfide isomerase/thioredoxin